MARVTVQSVSIKRDTEERSTEEYIIDEESANSFARLLSRVSGVDWVVVYAADSITRSKVYVRGHTALSN